MDPVEPLAIVVPLKSFAVAKSRLRRAGVSDVELRSREMASHVLESAKPRPVYVSCESLDVVTFARDRHLEVLISAATNLNAAITHARDALKDSFDKIMIAHGDLLYPRGLGSYEPSGGITIFTDHRGTGTNVLVVPTHTDFRFTFGPDSARAHLREAERLGLATQIISDSPWRFDVDEPSDLPS